MNIQLGEQMMELQLDICSARKCVLSNQDILQSAIVIRIVDDKCISAICRVDGGQCGFGIGVDGNFFSGFILPNSVVEREDLITDGGTSRCVEQSLASVGQRTFGDSLS